MSLCRIKLCKVRRRINIGQERKKLCHYDILNFLLFTTFYVKSLFTFLKRHILPFWQLYQLWNFILMELCIVKFQSFIKIKSAYHHNGSFWALKLQKLIFTQNVKQRKSILILHQLAWCSYKTNFVGCLFSSTLDTLMPRTNPCLWYIVKYEPV